MNHISLAKKKFGEVGPVLTRYPCYKRSFVHDLSTIIVFKANDVILAQVTPGLYLNDF